VISLKRLFGRFDKRKPIDFAVDTYTDIDRPAIDAFLMKALPEEEHEFIESYWISDEASILDCSMADPGVLIENINNVYGVRLSLQELKMSLHVLVDHVKALSR